MHVRGVFRHDCIQHVEISVKIKRDWYFLTLFNPICFVYILLCNSSSMIYLPCARTSIMRRALTNTSPNQNERWGVGSGWFSTRIPREIGIDNPIAASFKRDVIVGDPERTSFWKEPPGGTDPGAPWCTMKSWHFLVGFSWSLKL